MISAEKIDNLTVILKRLNDGENPNAIKNEAMEFLASVDPTELSIAEQKLIEAEPHHQREEEVLFPEVEKRGVTGPTRIMAMEHVDLRRYKHEIQDLVGSVENMTFTEFKNRLNSSAKLLILTLRDHIFKENNILYPTALDVINDAETWDKLKEGCDKIGYCCFTPKA